MKGLVKRLYELQTQIDMYVDMLDIDLEEGDDLDIDERLEELKEELQKLELDKKDCVRALINWKAATVGKLAEKERIKKIAYRRFKKEEDKLEFIKKLIREQVDNAENNNIDLGDFTLKLERTQPRLNITNENLIPEEFKKVTVDYKNKEIKKYIKETGDITFATLEENYRVAVR